MFGHIKFIWVNRHSLSYLWKFRSWLVKYPATATDAVVAAQEADDKAAKRKQVCDQIYKDLTDRCKQHHMTIPERSDLGTTGHPNYARLVFQSDKIVPETRVILPDGSSVDVIAARSEELKHNVTRVCDDLRKRISAVPVVAAPKAKKARKAKRKAR